MPQKQKEKEMTPVPPHEDMQMPLDDPNLQAQPGRLTEERFKLFRTRLAAVFGGVYQDREQVFFTELLEKLNEGLPTSTMFGTGEATDACTRMSDDNELMLADGIVYKI